MPDSVWLTVLKGWVLIIISKRKFEVYWMKHTGNNPFQVHAHVKVKY